MAKLTGLVIQKLLPNTNCKECGSNTCMAFAMKLASQKADLSQCPYASDEAKRVIGAASEPPVKGIELGPDGKVIIGAETVLYRHEKTFVHPTLLAININDTDPPEQIDATLKSIQDYELIRAGQIAKVDMVSVTQKLPDGHLFIQTVQKAWDVTKRPLVLRSKVSADLAEAAKMIRGSRSILASATPDSLNELKKIAQDNCHVLALTAPDLDQLISLADQLKKDKFENIVLDFNSKSLDQSFTLNIVARRAALKDNFKPLGYPTLSFLDTTDIMDTTIRAMTEISKYGGICVLPTFDSAQLLTLMTQRMGIFTDPQKPIQVDPKIYQIGEPTKDSPVFVTTNFSLTFFIVSGEIENSGTSAWLVVPECEGMSVLTAWAAGKFNGKTIAKFIKESTLESTVNTRKIIIPGYVATISGELEDGLPGWKVLVGPQDAADIESYMKSLKNL
jgi:acetyl-CoA decarbonylase/synthase complex subunit gamma